MKLSYSDLISPFPFKTSICSIKSPTLSDVWKITYDVYLSYIKILSLTPQIFCTKINTSLENWFNSLSGEQKQNITLLDICSVDNTIIPKISDALNFFIIENIFWNNELSSFVVYDSKDEKGNIIPKSFIHSKVWKELIGIIFQLNGINSNEEELQETKAKNQKALEIMSKLKKGREKNKKNKEPDKNLQLDNLVSVVANKHPSLNMLNIWDITVYQLWDAFSRLSENNLYDIGALSISVWGDEKKQFNISDWYKRIDY